MMQDITQLIRDHVMRRPKARAQDIYKLLYQGVFGVGHIISDRAWDVLVEEVNSIDLDAHREDPLIEPVSLDGAMIRVNLRQYIKSGGDLLKLFNVMKDSMEIVGDPVIFREYWAQFERLVTKGVFQFSILEIKELDEKIEREGVKPRHHTEAYRQAYYPAYRVVVRKIFYEKTRFCE